MFFFTNSGTNCKILSANQCIWPVLNYLINISRTLVYLHSANQIKKFLIYKIHKDNATISINQRS